MCKYAQHVSTILCDGEPGFRPSSYIHGPLSMLIDAIYVILGGRIHLFAVTVTGSEKIWSWRRRGVDADEEASAARLCLGLYS